MGTQPNKKALPGFEPVRENAVPARQPSGTVASKSLPKKAAPSTPKKLVDPRPKSR